MNQIKLQPAKHQRIIAPNQAPHIAVITALPVEHIAFEVLMENTVRFNAPGKGAGRRYLIGDIAIEGGGVHRVVLSMLTDMGNNMSASRTTRVLEHFPNVDCVFMVGIAGGVPHPEKPDDHVRLGDIVVSDRGGVVQYDNVKTTSNITEYRYPPRPSDALFLEAAQHLTASAYAKNTPWHSDIEKICSTLGIQRPADEADVLVSSDEGGQTIIHPDDLMRQRGWPRVFHGRIGSATNLMKNAKRRDELRDTLGLRAIEMEGSGVADATWMSRAGFMVVRGISDYCDSVKNDLWQPYAAAVAAAYAKTLIASVSADSLQETVEGSEDSHLAQDMIPPEALDVKTELTKPVSEKSDDVMTLLQQCPGGLPASVLCRAVGCNQPELEQMFLAEIANKEIIVDELQWSITLDASNLYGDCSISRLTMVLEDLLHYVQHHHNSHLSRRQISTITELARRCRYEAPQTVSTVFHVLNSHLKRIGDKNLVWEIAKLSIDAAHSITGIRPIDVVKNEAIALVCGLCWVLQREGAISRARVYAEDSLKLGQAIPWPRNDAFCKKCLGRIYRLEAMETNDLARRKELFQQSEVSLRDAIRCFGELTDSDKDEEIGDCLSLLGRTYLMSGQHNEAKESIWKALKALSDNGDKDYLDLQILSGDYYAETGDPDAALTFYTDVIDQHFKDDYEKSAMKARALLRRSHVYWKQGVKMNAQRDVRQSLHMYSDIKDTLGEAEAKWAEYVIDESVPKDVLDGLRQEPLLIRTAAARSYLEQLEGAPTTVVARRSKPTDQEIARLVREARLRSVQEVPSRL